MQRLLRSCLLLCLYITPACGHAEHEDHDHGPDGDHTHEGDHAHDDEASTAPGATAADMLAAGGGTTDTYPLANCPVSGEALGSMGDPVVLNQPGREVQLCCNSCVASYEGDTAKFNAEIDAAIIEAQSASYPLTTCLISGDTLGESSTMVAVDHVVGNRLYKLCCDACVKSLEKDLPKYRAELIAAAK